MVSTLTLRDVRGNRGRGAPYLVCQPELLLTRKCLSRSVTFCRKVHRQLPDLQVAITLNCHRAPASPSPLALLCLLPRLGLLVALRLRLLFALGLGFRFVPGFCLFRRLGSLARRLCLELLGCLVRIEEQDPPCDLAVLDLH